MTWHCLLGGRKGIQPVKTKWWDAGGVICLGWGVDLHMAQLMPLPLNISCFWYWLIWVVTDKGPLNGCFVCVVMNLCPDIIWLPDASYLQKFVYIRSCVEQQKQTIASRANGRRIMNWCVLYYTISTGINTVINIYLQLWTQLVQTYAQPTSLRSSWDDRLIKIRLLTCTNTFVDKIMTLI